MSALKKEVPMPWLEVRPMDAKILFISDWIRSHTRFSELCEKHEISRKTGYKWVGRYQDTGIDGLQDRSRRPSRSPNKVPYTIQKEIIAERKKHKRWGSRKINKILENKYPDWDIPSHQTIHRILKEADLLSPQRRRQRVPMHPGPLEGAKQPNDLWTVDFKGQFKTWDGAYCYPLTVMDQASRYLLGCDGFPGTRYKETRKAFERLFREYGLPSRIRSDNGVPFASRSIGGLSKLGVWWVRLGIIPERIESGKPQQNGHHERMHRTLKQETAKPPANNMEQQQRRFDRFRDEYNTVRPHESLDMNTPANRYKPSERPYPKRLPEMIYPGHFKETLVNHNGCIHLNGKFYYLGYLLRGELVGLNEINDGIWETYFGPLRLGEVSERLK
jgi:transposase InsO family protein